MFWTLEGRAYLPTSVHGNSRESRAISDGKSSYDGELQLDSLSVRYLERRLPITVILSSRADGETQWKAVGSVSSKQA
jgi:hypothetical protein